MTDRTQPARWYMVDKDGMATLCTDREDAEQEAKDANMAWPHTAPHRAVQLVEVADVEAMRAGYAAARLEIESLRGKRWQPIATAPEDGTCVLVYPPTWNDKNCSMAQYESDKYATKPRPYWSRDDALGKVGYSRNKPPTHWMPLPAGPADGESNELC